MSEAVLTKTGTVLQGLRSTGRALKRGVVAVFAAAVLVVLYGLGSIGTQIVSAVGITGITVAATTATSTPAQAKRRGRRRRGRRRRRRRRGGKWIWFWEPYWYW